MGKIILQFDVKSDRLRGLFTALLIIPGDSKV